MACGGCRVYIHPVKTFLRAGLIASSLLALPLSAASKVEVAFTNPEKFTDIQTEHLDNGSRRGELLKVLEAQFSETVSPRVKAGDHLSLTFTDIDLAGDYRMGWQMGATRVRIVNEHYAPRLAFDFVLTDAAGQVVAKGHRDITDHSFLNTTSSADHDGFKFEKNLLRQWARKELSQ